MPIAFRSGVHCVGRIGLNSSVAMGTAAPEATPPLRNRESKQSHTLCFEPLYA